MKLEIIARWSTVDQIPPRKVLFKAIHTTVNRAEVCNMVQNVGNKMVDLLY